MGRKFFSLEGLTVGAILASIIATAFWLGGTRAFDKLSGSDVGAGRTQPGPQTTSPPMPRVTPSAKATPTKKSQPGATTSATRQRSTSGSTSATSASAVAAIAAGVCDRATSYRGISLPRVTTDYGQAPLGSSVTFNVIGERSANGIPIDLLDGACVVHHLFNLYAGQTRSIRAFAGQTLIMNAGHNGGSGTIDGTGPWNVGN
jgi:hypothetical protein